MIAETSALLRTEFGRASESLALSSAKFLRIVNCGVIAHRDRPTEHFAELQYVGRDGPVAVFLTEDRGVSPERRGDDPTQIRSARLTANLTGTYEVVQPVGHAGFLSFIVESIRAAHAALSAEARDIWFTGLYGASLPVEDTYYRGIEGVHITQNRIRRFRGHFNTLVTVEPFLDQKLPNFSVSFSYRTP